MNHAELSGNKEEKTAGNAVAGKALCVYFECLI